MELLCTVCPVAVGSIGMSCVLTKSLCAITFHTQSQVHELQLQIITNNAVMNKYMQF